MLLRGVTILTGDLCFYISSPVDMPLAGSAATGISTPAQGCIDGF